MSDKFLDKFEDALDSDEEDEETDTQNVNEALSDDDKYWSSRNKVQKAKDAIQDDEDDDNN